MTHSRGAHKADLQPHEGQKLPGGLGVGFPCFIFNLTAQAKLAAPIKSSEE